MSERIDTLEEIRKAISSLREDILFPENEAWERGLECYPNGPSSTNFLMALAHLEQAELCISAALHSERKEY